MADVRTLRGDILEDDDFDTILSPDIEFIGTITLEKPFLIRGRVSGQISSTSLLAVDTGAVVEAGVSASRLILRGSVKGDVTATEKVEITGTGRLQGDVATPEISMEAGCVFNGRCTMPEPGQGV